MLMASVQSPPGMLNIFELFIALKIAPITLRVSEEIYIARSNQEADDYCTIFTIIDTPDASRLEYLFKEKLYPAEVKLALIRISLFSNQQFQSFKIDPYSKKYLDEDSLRQDLSTFLAVHDCRDLLSNKYLKAYAFYNYAYHELPAEFWFYDKNWYRLLVDGCAQGNIPNIGDILGSVYFKKEDVNY